MVYVFIKTLHGRSPSCFLIITLQLDTFRRKMNALRNECRTSPSFLIICFFVSTPEKSNWTTSRISSQSFGLSGAFLFVSNLHRSTNCSMRISTAGSLLIQSACSVSVEGEPSLFLFLWLDIVQAPCGKRSLLRSLGLSVRGVDVKAWCLKSHNLKLKSAHKSSS